MTMETLVVTASARFWGAAAHVPVIYLVTAAIEVVPVVAAALVHLLSMEFAMLQNAQRVRRP